MAVSQGERRRYLRHGSILLVPIVLAFVGLVLSIIATANCKFMTLKIDDYPVAGAVLSGYGSYRRTNREITKHAETVLYPLREVNYGSKPTPNQVVQYCEDILRQLGLSGYCKFLGYYDVDVNAGLWGYGMDSFEVSDNYGNSYSIGIDSCQAYDEPPNTQTIAGGVVEIDAFHKSARAFSVLATVFGGIALMAFLILGVFYFFGRRLRLFFLGLFINSFIFQGLSTLLFGAELCRNVGSEEYWFLDTNCVPAWGCIICAIAAIFWVVTGICVVCLIKDVTPVERATEMTPRQSAFTNEPDHVEYTNEAEPVVVTGVLAEPEKEANPQVIRASMPPLQGRLVRKIKAEYPDGSCTVTEEYVHEDGTKEIRKSTYPQGSA